MNTAVSFLIFAMGFFFVCGGIYIVVSAFKD